MEATKSRHANPLRASRFASIGVVGVWLLNVAPGSTGARGQEPAAAVPEAPPGADRLPPQAPPAPIPVDAPAAGAAVSEVPPGADRLPPIPEEAQVPGSPVPGPAAPAPPPAAAEPPRHPAPPPAPVVRQHYGSYLFFGPGGRRSQPAANDPARVAPRTHPARQPYLFFTPTPGAGARGPGARPAAGAGAGKPPEAPGPADPLEAIPEAGAVHASGARTLIYFTPDPGWARAQARAGSGSRSGGTTTRSALRAVGAAAEPPRPARPADADKVPVRVPEGRSRKPLPYLFFQPNDARKDSASGTPGPRPSPGAALRPAAAAPASGPARVANGRRGPDPQRRPDTPRPAAPGPRRGTAPASTIRPDGAREKALPGTQPKPRPTPTPAPPSYRLALENQARHETIAPLPIPTGARPHRVDAPPLVNVFARAKGGTPAPAPAQAQAQAQAPAPAEFAARPTAPRRTVSTQRPRPKPAAPPSNPIRLTAVEAEPPRTPAPALLRPGDSARNSGPARP